MHADELEIDEGLVRRLLATQFPDWAGLELRRIEPSGTDNAIFRLDHGLSIEHTAQQLRAQGAIASRIRSQTIGMWRVG
jgi:aminoglycoside phosphotransferase (APT) family kinase protein